jgi:hypothetical protein
MTPSNETDLRQRVAGLALAWQEESRPFAGAARDEYPPMIEAAHVVADEARLALHRWIGDRTNDLDDTDHIVRHGANAFNEMAIMAEEGAKGRELVGTGMLCLTFVQTDRAWEYRRMVGIGPDTEAMAAHGWQLVSSWLPFHYFKRPVN